MSSSSIIVLGLSWFLINIMAAYGAAVMFGEMAWIYVVFLVMYIWYTGQITSGGKK